MYNASMLLGLSFAHWLVLVSAFLSLAGSAAYVRDTLAGRTKPNRVSWFLWALAPILGSAAAISAGGDIWATVRVFLAGFVPLIVLVASFANPRSYWQISRFDLACGLCSLLALIMWGVIGSPVLAILFFAMGDGFATLPTIYKAWKFPETETGITFLLGLLAVILILPSIPKWNIENSAFQIYLLIANSFIAFSIYRKKLFAAVRSW